MTGHYETVQGYMEIPALALESLRRLSMWLRGTLTRVVYLDTETRRRILAEFLELSQEEMAIKGSYNMSTGNFCLRSGLRTMTEIRPTEAD
jgi:hypothetical protein